MRDLFKLLAVGIVIFFVPYAHAEQFKVLVIPDNIVSENDALDSYIYNASAEFFSGEVINILNHTDYIKAPTVSETRSVIRNSPTNIIPVRNLMNKYRTSYNIDFTVLKKIAANLNSRYVLLITSNIDSENYILRRTLWDFLNVGGATVIDPAYKISTYAVLVDTSKNVVLWSDTFYKTISVCENRIITRGASPQTEQLEKIKDYSRILCPEIAQNVQKKVVPAALLAKESNVIYYDAGNIDNVFTKKYRRWKVEGDKIYTETKTNLDEKITVSKEYIEKKKAERKTEKANKIKQLLDKPSQTESLEVKAEPVNIKPQDIDIKPQQKQQQEKTQMEKPQQTKIQQIKVQPEQKVETDSFVQKKQLNNVHNVNYKIYTNEDQSLFPAVDIKKKRVNNLTGEYDAKRPPLRDYNY